MKQEGDHQRAAADPAAAALAAGLPRAKAPASPLALQQESTIMTPSPRKPTADTPSVAVVIPTRNCLRYLPAAVASVWEQSIPSLQLIVIDDGSDDGTATWLQELQQQRPNVLVLHGAGDGPDFSRNKAIAATTAPLVAFLDADDLWYAGKLAAQLAFHHADPEAVFSFTDYLHVDPTGARHGTACEYWPQFRRLLRSGGGTGYRRLPDAQARILAENAVGTSTVVARRDALQNANGFNATLRSASDWDLWLRLARQGPVGFTGAVGTQYLMLRPGSISVNLPARIHEMRRIVDTHAASLGGEHRRAVHLATAHILQTEAELARQQLRYCAAARAGVHAACLAPSIRNIRLVLADLVRAVTTRRAARPPATAG